MSVAPVNEMALVLNKEKKKKREREKKNERQTVNPFLGLESLNWAIYFLRYVWINGHIKFVYYFFIFQDQNAWEIYLSYFVI